MSTTTAPATEAKAEPKAPAIPKAKATAKGLTAAGYVTFTDRLVRHFHLAASGQQPAEDGTVRAACGARFWPAKAEMAFAVGQDLAVVSCATCCRGATWRTLTDGRAPAEPKPAKAKAPRRPKATKAPEAEVVATVHAIEAAVAAAKPKAVRTRKPRAPKPAPAE